ncbi:MAG: hypothetical protein HY282_05190 [Nitrospirae bacterium]|nr:hypothetical protein [Candidatus Manganitrophaceae bacterium]
MAILARATNIPIAASIMPIEFFGPLIAAWAAVARVASFLITEDRSVYPTRIIGAAPVFIFF